MNKQAMWAVGRIVSGKFKVRKVVRGRLMARMERNDGESAYAIISVKIDKRRRA